MVRTNGTTEEVKEEEEEGEDPPEDVEARMHSPVDWEPPAVPALRQRTLINSITTNWTIIRNN